MKEEVGEHLNNNKTINDDHKNNNNNILNNRKRTKDITIENDNITFSELLLSKQVIKGLEESGYVRPSPIQLKAIPLGISGTDLIAQAKSGTGKTVVFGVIALEYVLKQSKLLRDQLLLKKKESNNNDDNEDEQQKQQLKKQERIFDLDDDSYCEMMTGVTRKQSVLIIAPTREIAVQIKDVVNTIGRYCTRVRAGAFIGGLGGTGGGSKKNEEIDDTIGHNVSGKQIIVGTPGRIKSMIENLELRTDDIGLMILDEADKLLDASFSKIINWIYTALPAKKQILAFSATYPTALLNILSTYMKSPVQIRLCADTPQLEGITQFYQIVHSNNNNNSSSTTTTNSNTMAYKIFQNKVSSLKLVLQQMSFYQAIIFCNNRIRAEELLRLLNREGWPSSYISGSQSQSVRLQTMSALKQFKLRILISTDLISRGIDIERVNLIVNFDLPRDFETYFHRIGRTGRFGTYGVALTLLSPDDTVEKQFLNDLVQLYNVNIKERRDNDPIPEELYLYQFSTTDEQQSLDQLKEKQQKYLENKQEELELQTFMKNNYKNNNNNSRKFNNYQQNNIQEELEEDDDDEYGYEEELQFIWTYGETENGYPNELERESHLLLNAVRIDPINYKIKFMTKEFGNLPGENKILTNYQPTHPLYYNRELNQLSRSHSIDMATNGCFSHTDCNGTSVLDRFKNHIQDCKLMEFAENIEAGITTGIKANNNWLCEKKDQCPEDNTLESGHRKSIMNPNLNGVGVGYYYSKNDKLNYHHYWTQDFFRTSNCDRVFHGQIHSGFHTFLSGDTNPTFLATFYYAVPPTSAKIIFNGQPNGQDLTLFLGNSSHGVYSYTPSSPPNECIKYRFEFKSSAGTHIYPDTGSLHYTSYSLEGNHDKLENCLSWSNDPVN
eukprot:gene5819-7243_t